MNKFSVFCLLFLALVAIASSEELKRLRLKKGTRNLDTQQTYKSVFAVGDAFFFVDSDFGPDYAAQEEWTNTSSAPMMSIMISSNETVLSDRSCYSQFNQEYDCQPPLCTPVENSSFILELPIISGNVTRLSYNFTNTSTTTPVSIVNGSWQLNSQPLIINQCSKYGYFAYPDDESTYGWIGLGTEGNGSANFLTSGDPIFSTHLNASAGSGELIFGFDEGRTTNSASPIANLVTDELWRMNVTTISSGSVNSTPNISFTVVFDLLYEGIALPQDLFQSLMDQLSENSDTNYCTGDTDDLDDCNFVGQNLTTIPDMAFTLADGTKLNIPAACFWKSNNDDFVPLPDGSNNNYWYLKSEPITTNNSGSNYAVLGWRVMSCFYSVFTKTATGNTVTLYNPVPEYEGAVYVPVVVTPPDTTTPGTPPDTTTPGTPPDTTTPGTPPDTTVPDTGSGYLYYYIGGIIGLVIIIAFVFFACRGSPKPSSPTKKRELNVELRASP